MADSMADPPGNIVVIGGGHAAAQLCAGLAEAGLGARVHLVCESAHLPYQRPPLSKAYLKSADEALQLHRPQPWYAQAGITVHRADPALAIQRAQRSVLLRSGATLPYDHVVLATGSRARRLPALHAGLANVLVLRSADDALHLRTVLAPARRLTVLGGGFIGLEVACTALALGLNVRVLEAAPRLLARSLSPELAQHVLDTHRASGMQIAVGATVDGFAFDGDRLVTLHADGAAEGVELLLLGLGAAPEQSLAEAAGLACDQGIVVDRQMRTSDPRILAVGDCARFPSRDGTLLRLESVQNANDQARTAVATLLGREQPYQALPWFWSEQGSLRLQMAGLMPPDGTRHLRPGANAGSFSLLHYTGDRLACVESVNAALDHVAARKLLETGKSPPPAHACDPAVPLKSLL